MGNAEAGEVESVYVGNLFGSARRQFLGSGSGSELPTLG